MVAGRLPPKLHPKVLRRKVFAVPGWDFVAAGVRGQLHGDGSASVSDAESSLQQRAFEFSA